jgi:hypothetical protein
MDIWYDSLDGKSARRKAFTYTGQHNTEKRGHIHASSGIPSRDPSVRAVEDSTCLRRRSHWDRRAIINEITNLFYRRVLYNSLLPEGLCFQVDLWFMRLVHLKGTVESLSNNSKSGDFHDPKHCYGWYWMHMHENVMCVYRNELSSAL